MEKQKIEKKLDEANSIVDFVSCCNLLVPLPHRQNQRTPRSRLAYFINFMSSSEMKLCPVGYSNLPPSLPCDWPDKLPIKSRLPFLASLFSRMTNFIMECLEAALPLIFFASLIAFHFSMFSRTPHVSPVTAHSMPCKMNLCCERSIHRCVYMSASVSRNTLGQRSSLTLWY